MRADRLVSILLLLQVGRRMTGRELAERLGVSKRTIYRDMDALSAAGIPVIADRGPGGGWSLLDGYQMSLTGLSEDEIQALFLSKPARLLADLGLLQASETALRKLLAALPTMYRRDAEYIRQRIHVDGTGWHHAEENVAFLPILQQAIWQERKLQLTYHLSTGPIVEPLLDPLGLVAKGSVWYLVAVYEDRLCVYRVSRVQDARMTARPCVRPKGFDLAAFWEQSSAEFRASRLRYPAIVRAAPGIVPQMHHRDGFARIEQVDRPDAEGWVSVSVQFETQEQACAYVLRFGTQIEVVEPEALRQKIIGLVEGLAALYGQGPHVRR